MKSILNIIICLGMLSFHSQVFAQRVEAPIQINIDNPGFRKMVVAVTKINEGKNTPYRKRLQELLEFSGFFKVLSPRAFTDLEGPNLQTLGIKDTMQSLDIESWRGLGVETLIYGKIFKSDRSYRVHLVAANIYSKQKITSLHLKKVSSQNIDSALRKFADQIIEKLSGKSGIFNSKIVFIGKKNKGSFKQVYTSNFDGSNLKQITNFPAIHLSPSYSPDGRYITYTSFKDNNPDLFVYDTKTGRHKKVSGRRGMNSGGAWSHNSKVIAFTSAGKPGSGDTDLYSVNPNGGKPSKLIAGRGLDVEPSFSPNGKWVAYVSGRYGNPHIFAAELDWNSGLKILKDQRLTYAGWYNASPDWSPDSKKIAFASYDKEIDRFDLFMMDPDGKNMERLSLRTGDNESPAWSPNGQLIAFQSSRVGTANIKDQYHLYTMKRDGSEQKEIKLPLFEVTQPDWGPNLDVEF